MSPHWIALGASARGTAHETFGVKNQDAVQVQAGPFGSVLLAVSDGHGGPPSFRSDRGSRLAVECGTRLLVCLLRRLGPEATLSQLRAQLAGAWARGVVAAWRHAVREDVRARPFAPIEFAHLSEPMPATPFHAEWPFAAYLTYGATLLVAAVTRRFLLCAQLGDGDILSVAADGTVHRPLPRRHDFHGEESASLCTVGAAAEFQIAVHPLRLGRPAAIMLSSDGYANCFGHDEGFFKVGSDLLAYAREHGPAFLREHLGNWLVQSSRDGSGDDISIGLALNRGALRK